MNNLLLVIFFHSDSFNSIPVKFDKIDSNPIESYQKQSKPIKSEIINKMLALSFLFNTDK